jgi:hypothetical protein
LFLWGIYIYRERERARELCCGVSAMHSTDRVRVMN